MLVSRVTARWVLAATIAGPASCYAALYVPKSVSGDLGYDYRQTRYDNGYTTTSNMLTGRIVTDAYLWQPWFATVGLSFAATQERSATNGGSDTNSHFSTGELNMAVLPVSHFPFTLRYSVTDSRLDYTSNDNPLISQSTARQFSRNNLQITQGVYGEKYRLNFRYNNDDAKSDQGEHYVQDGYGIDYTWRGHKQNLSANALYQTQTNNQSNSESSNTVVALNHSYYPSDYTGLDTVASHVKVDNFYTTLVSGLNQQVTNTIDQASTTLGWRSSVMPLRVQAGLRVHQMDYQLDNGTTTNTIQTEGLNSSLGASYQFGEHLSSSVNSQYSVLRNENEETRSHNEGAVVSYVSERHDIGGFDYGWNSTLTGSNQQSGESRAQAVSVAAGHGVIRSWRLESRATVRLSVNQDLTEGYNHSSGPPLTAVTSGTSGETRRIGHSLNLGWMRNSQSGTSMAQMTLSDSRGVIGDESTSQMANLQLSRSEVVSNRSSLSGNLSWQAWHYNLPGTPDYGIGQTTAASASYRYSRPFTLQRVTYISDLRLSDNQPPIGPSIQETFLDNRFVHEIGMLRSSLSLTYRDHKGVKSVMLLISVKRLF